MDFPPIFERFTISQFSKTFFHTGKLFLRKKYGENKNWGYLEQSQYIESIILSHVLKGIVLKQRVDEFQFNDYIILDGYERIKTLLSFLNNNFSLRYLVNLPELNGFNYEKLSSEVPDILDCFLFSQLPLVIFPNHTPKKYLKLIYNRRNPVQWTI